MPTKSSKKTKPYYALRIDDLKSRYISGGINALSPQESVELFMSYLASQESAAACAQKIMDRFGSVSAFLHASRAELRNSPGMNAVAALLVSMLRDIHCIAVCQAAVGRQVTRRSEMCRMFYDMLSSLTEEHLIVACLNADRRITCCKIISKGENDAVRVVAEKILDLVKQYRANAVILAHNHPSVVCDPSNDDIYQTVNLGRLFSGMNVALLDHIVVGVNGANSIYETVKSRAKTLKSGQKRQRFQ